MIVKHSEVPVDPETRERAVELLEGLAVASRAEDGVIDYRVTVDLEDPNVLRIIERYEDSAAAAEHEASDHLAAFEADIAPHLDGVPELLSFEVTAMHRTEGP